MSSVFKVECGICLYEKEVFKVLHCGHKYCQDCCIKLQTATEDLDSSNSTNETIICPSCQDVTQLQESSVDQLATSVTYTVACFNCNVKKLTTDILWCHICNLFVCSTCLIDKHGDSMSNIVHNASKWDSHLAITSALGGLLKNRLAAKKNSINVKFVAETYVDSLKSYLRSKVDKQLVERETEILVAIDQFAKCYSIEASVLDNAAPIDEFEKLRSILVAAANVAKQSVSVPTDATLIAFHSVSYDYLTECLLNECRLSRSSYWEHSLSLLSAKLITKENVTPLSCQFPCDILRVDCITVSGTILLDANLGPIASFHSAEPPMLKKRGKEHYGRFIRGSTTGDLMVTFQTCNKESQLGTWVFDFMYCTGITCTNELSLNKFLIYRPSDYNGGVHKSLMVNENVSVLNTSDDIFAAADKTIYIYNDCEDKEDFEPFFVSESETACFSEIGDIVSSAKLLTFYIFNNKFNRIDLLKFSDRCERKLISWRQVSLAQLCPEVEIFAEPRICRLPDHGNCYLLWDRNFTKLFLWDEKAKTCKLVADLINRNFQNIVVYKDHSMYFISKDINTDRRLIHRVQL